MNLKRIASLHHQGQRLRKTSRWAQFVAMVFAQLSGRQSLRDIETNLEAQRQQHLFATKPVSVADGMLITEGHGVKSCFLSIVARPVSSMGFVDMS